MQFSHKGEEDQKRELEMVELEMVGYGTLPLLLPQCLVCSV